MAKSQSLTIDRKKERQCYDLGVKVTPKQGGEWLDTKKRKTRKREWERLSCLLTGKHGVAVGAGKKREMHENRRKTDRKNKKKSKRDREARLTYSLLNMAWKQETDKWKSKERHKARANIRCLAITMVTERVNKKITISHTASNNEVGCFHCRAVSQLCLVTKSCNTILWEDF